mmetsp:Transcript_119666/g.211484  ORF Transcript_119666/g.211484 Transcript_119666/m.211484 type:complete len:251 (+) Transcript_119666:70-822(+)
MASARSEQNTAEVIHLRGELTRLDAELREATSSLRMQRDTFARQVAAHDAGRADRADEVAAALEELEAGRGCMEDLHHELEEERHRADMLEAECEELERAASRAACKEGEELAARRQRSLLQQGLRQLFNQALKAAEATAGRAERQIEQASYSIGATTAATRAFTAGLAREHRESSRMWSLEIDGLLSALLEAEQISGQQLSFRQRQRDSLQDTSSSSAAERVTELARLRHEAAVELRAGVMDALAPWVS